MLEHNTKIYPTLFDVQGRLPGRGGISTDSTGHLDSNFNPVIYELTYPGRIIYSLLGCSFHNENAGFIGFTTFICQAQRK